MKIIKCIQLIAIASILLVSVQSKAQMADDGIVGNETQKTVAYFKITPSVPSFRADISIIDGDETKFCLRVRNSEGKKCTITIRNDGGFLWSSNFKNAYYTEVFNLSSVEDGEYSIRVSDGRNSFERKIMVSTKSYTQRNIRLN